MSSLFKFLSLGRRNQQQTVVDPDEHLGVLPTIDTIHFNENKRHEQLLEKLNGFATEKVHMLIHPHELKGILRNSREAKYVIPLEQGSTLQSQTSGRYLVFDKNDEIHRALAKYAAKTHTRTTCVSIPRDTLREGTIGSSNISDNQKFTDVILDEFRIHTHIVVRPIQYIHFIRVPHGPSAGWYTVHLDEITHVFDNQQADLVLDSTYYRNCSGIELAPVDGGRYAAITREQAARFDPLSVIDGKSYRVFKNRENLIIDTSTEPTWRQVQLWLVSLRNSKAKEQESK